jgi:hypothetical protein
MRAGGKLQALGAMAAMILAGASCGGGGPGGGGGGGSGGSGDACAPYTGSYSGIYTFTWSCVNDPSMDGVGTIAVHFTAECQSTMGDTVNLEVTRIMSDNAVLGALTETEAPEGGLMRVPASPPATSGPDHYVSLIFPNDNHLLDTSGTFTVTTGAAILASDTDNHEAFNVGDDVTSEAGRPDGCVVDSRTFKIDKD